MKPFMYNLARYIFKFRFVESNKLKRDYNRNSNEIAINMIITTKVKLDRILSKKRQRSGGDACGFEFLG